MIEQGKDGGATTYQEIKGDQHEKGFQNCGPWDIRGFGWKNHSSAGCNGQKINFAYISQLGEVLH